MHMRPRRVSRLLSAMLSVLAVGMVGAGLAWACTPDGTQDEPPAPPGPAADSGVDPTPPASRNVTSGAQQSPATAVDPAAQTGPTGSGSPTVSDGPTQALGSDSAASRRSGTVTQPAGTGSAGDTSAGSASRAAGRADAAVRTGSGGRSTTSPRGSSPSERSIASDPRSRFLASPTVATSSAPEAGPGGQLGLGLALSGLGLLSLCGVLLVGVSRRRRPAAARSPRS